MDMAIGLPSYTRTTSNSTSSNSNFTDSLIIQPDERARTDVAIDDLPALPVLGFHIHSDRHALFCRLGRQAAYRETDIRRVVFVVDDTRQLDVILLDGNHATLVDSVAGLPGLRLDLLQERHRNVAIQFVEESRQRTANRHTITETLLQPFKQLNNLGRCGAISESLCTFCVPNDTLFIDNKRCGTIASLHMDSHLKGNAIFGANGLCGIHQQRKEQIIR